MRSVGSTMPSADHAPREAAMFFRTRVAPADWSDLTDM